MVSIIIDSRRLKSSPSTGDWLIVRHWIPTPATSYRAKYLDPRPNAVVDIKDCRERTTCLLKINSLSKWNMKGIHGKPSYRYALLKGSNFVVSHLFSYGHIHVRHITQKVDDSSTCWSQFGFGVQHRHKETSQKGNGENFYITSTTFDHCSSLKNNANRMKQQVHIRIWLQYQNMMVVMA